MLLGAATFAVTMVAVVLVSNPLMQP